MRPDFWVVQTFNGLSYGALLFLLASGLSLIFGVMRIVNMAHGSYFMLGGYLGLTVALRTRSFAMAVLAGSLAIALVGMGTVMRPLVAPPAELGVQIVDVRKGARREEGIPQV